MGSEGNEGNGEVVEVSETVNISDDRATYYPEEDVVVYTAKRNGDQPASYGSMSYDRFVKFRCLEVAQKELESIIDNRFNTSRDGVWLGTGITAEEVMVHPYEGKEPSQAEARATLPDAFDVTVSLFNETESCRAPVTVDEDTSYRPE